MLKLKILVRIYVYVRRYVQEFYRINKGWTQVGVGSKIEAKACLHKYGTIIYTIMHKSSSPDILVVAQ